jgi:hypothetical protein
MHTFVRASSVPVSQRIHVSCRCRFVAIRWLDAVLSAVKRLRQPPSRRWISCALGGRENTTLPKTVSSDSPACSRVSRRALELAFHDHLGPTPARFIAVLRLNAMRRELIGASEGNLRVADLAKRCGIICVGRFAGRYQRMFVGLTSAVAGATSGAAPTPCGINS